MTDPVSRRGFLKRSVAASLAAGAASSFEERALLAGPEGPSDAAPSPPSTPAAGAAGALPKGRIGDLEVSRIICGGNLISGFAHSRDLIYVSSLLKQYFTDEKVFETLERCEEEGIDTAILRVDSHTLRIVDRYWSQRGGSIRWIAQVKPKEKDLVTDIARALDAGATGAYVQGQVGDRFVIQGNVKLLGKALEIMRDRGARVAGLGGHALETIVACEKAGLEPDFYMKTLNSKSYWSAGPEKRHDSVWAETPGKTIEFMQGVKRPWIAFKVLAAGAIHPREGFDYAFRGGADFACVGMFDFQVTEDVILAKRVLSGLGRRPRPWRG